MYKASITLTRSGKGPSKDDKILIHETEESRDLFQVVYRSPDFVYKKTFVTSEHRVYEYLEDILACLQYDSDPFEHLQVDTIIHPPILYHVSDVDDLEVRKLIITTIRSAMRMDVANQ